jgi:hypothetical protein
LKCALTWIKGSTNTAFYPRILSICHGLYNGRLTTMGLQRSNSLAVTRDFKASQDRDLKSIKIIVAARPFAIGAFLNFLPIQLRNASLAASRAGRVRWPG